MQYNFKTINTRDLKGLKHAELLKRNGWEIIATGFYSITFQKPKKSNIFDYILNTKTF